MATLVNEFFNPFERVIASSAQPIDRTPPRGKFVVFDGIDGSGKGTQVAFLSKLLTTMGIRHVVTKQPGGSDLGDAIREIMFVKVGTKNIPNEVLCMLFDANELYNSKAVIEPALARGEWVITDRYWPSASAYRVVRPGGKFVDDYRRKMPVVEHDVFFLLNGNADVLLTRANARRGTPIDGGHQSAKSWNAAGQQKMVQQRFLEESGRDPRTAILDSTFADKRMLFYDVVNELRRRNLLRPDHSDVMEALSE